MANVSKIKGMDKKIVKKLKAANITTVDGYLSACEQKKARKELANQTSIDEARILNWANRADLSRIKGVSTQYGDLLECAGVDTVPELAQRNATNLHAKMKEVNKQQNLVKKLPTTSQVEDWVAQAKKLPRAIQY